MRTVVSAGIVPGKFLFSAQGQFGVEGTVCSAGIVPGKYMSFA